MTRLYQIRSEVQSRAETIAKTHGDWPCRKGCDDCCRQLAAEPCITFEEWQSIQTAIDTLPADLAAQVRQRIRDGAGKPRPVVCPLLETESGSCLVYEARPIACRSYGFYVERHQVLGCHRIESLVRESAGVVWGNHVSLDDRMSELGIAKELSEWMDVT